MNLYILNKIAAYLIILWLLAGCGGGSSVDSSGSDAQALPAVVISASPSTISRGESVTITWSTTDAVNCMASGDWVGSTDISGSLLIPGITAESSFNLQCSNATGSKTESVKIIVKASPGQSGTALISWLPPTQNTDNTILSDLAGYKFYYGTQPGNYSKTLTVHSSGITSYLFENLTSGTWYFAMTAYNSSNVESVKSAEVSKTIP